jgi:iron complex transport system ATP-binding protein
MTDSAPLLELENVSCGYAAKAVISKVGFSVEEGDIVCLLGPNGVGKTTLFKTILRLLPKLAGTIRINGSDIASWHAKRFACAMGYVPQVHTPPFPFSVIDVVVMGRVAHLDAFASPSPRDFEIAKKALHELAIEHLQKRVYTELSGGERQLVLIARALAQEPMILVLDEPTSNLDYGNQVAVLEHINSLAKERHIGIIMTTHDPNQALSYASTVVAIDRNRLLHIGSPDKIVCERYLRDTYHMQANVMQIAIDDKIYRYCLPLRSKHRVPEMKEP